MRFATLVIDRLSTHPAAQEAESRRALREIEKTVPDVILKLEALKPRINNRYEAWQKALATRHQFASVANAPIDAYEQSDPAVAGNGTTVTGADHPDLAVRVAHKEIRRRDAARRATRQAGISEEQEQERRTAGLWDDWEDKLSRGRQDDQDEDLQRRMQETRRTVDGSHDVRPDIVRKRLSKGDRRPVVRPAQPSTPSNNYSYPQVARSQPLQYEQAGPQPNKVDLPPKPPKVSIDSEWPLPPRPEKQPLDSEAFDGGASSNPITPVDEVPEKQFTFRAAAYLENGTPLRTVFLPPDLRTTFLTYAAANTKANLETCGILCGTLISNALFISRLVIPDQESTSDTCDTINEGALFDYCDSEDLMVLGWIHTHPSQTCFMSSRDLHTHSGYQVMMPEAIAIVCAPSKNPS